MVFPDPGWDLSLLGCVGKKGEGRTVGTLEVPSFALPDFPIDVV